jgi:hypothetical protein
MVTVLQFLMYQLGQDVKTETFMEEPGCIVSLNIANQISYFSINDSSCIALMYWSNTRFSKTQLLFYVIIKIKLRRLRRFVTLIYFIRKTLIIYC